LAHDGTVIPLARVSLGTWLAGAAARVSVCRRGSSCVGCMRGLGARGLGMSLRLGGGRRRTSLIRSSSLGTLVEGLPFVSHLLLHLGARSCGGRLGQDGNQGEEEEDTH